jgi:hypothetical protein
MCLWGTSFAGGHVLAVARDTPGITAIISQVWLAGQQQQQQQALQMWQWQQWQLCWQLHWNACGEHSTARNQQVQE